MLENIQLLERDLAWARGAEEPPPLPKRGKRSLHDSSGLAEAAVDLCWR